MPTGLNRERLTFFEPGLGAESRGLRITLEEHLRRRSRRLFAAPHPPEKVSAGPIAGSHTSPIELKELKGDPNGRPSSRLIRKAKFHRARGGTTSLSDAQREER